jgi:hypothetical protein
MQLSRVILYFEQCPNHWLILLFYRQNCNKFILLGWCITVLTETTWKLAPLLPRESVILASRKIEQTETDVRTTSEIEHFFLVTSYNTQGRKQYDAHGTYGHLFFRVFTNNCPSHYHIPPPPRKLNCSKLNHAEFDLLKGTRMQIMYSVAQLMIFTSMSLITNLSNFTHTRKKLTALPAPIFMKLENDQQH